ASWAVPKGVPLEPGQRVLAVHVEDHPLDYATFAGEIPKGNYGAGTVEIWDNGTYELVEEKPDGAAAPAGGFRTDYRAMLATLAERLPTGDGWLYEVKWDGYRALGYVRA